MNENRKLRIESIIKHLISDMIMRGEIKDPRVNSLVSITSTDIAGDLSIARLCVSSLEGKQMTEKAVKGLNQAAGFIQRQMGPRLRLRSVPRPVFFADNSVRSGSEINRRIDELLHGEGDDDS